MKIKIIICFFSLTSIFFCLPSNIFAKGLECSKSLAELRSVSKPPYKEFFKVWKSNYRQKKVIWRMKVEGTELSFGVYEVKLKCEEGNSESSDVIVEIPETMKSFAQSFTKGKVYNLSLKLLDYDILKKYIVADIIQ